ncbi:MAG: NHL repeat-containing protein, partial [Nitrosopumilus sp.]|nr:NHL repeat-containing protein [Nitrosopumilus sp.]
MDKKLLVSLCFGALLLMGTVSSQTANAELKFSLKFGAGSTENDLKNPTSVLVSSNGKIIYVVDTGNNRINLFKKDGTQSSKFGSSGSTDGLFQVPKGSVLDSLNGLLYVADTGNNRIQVFDDSGKFKLKFGSSGSADGQLNSPIAVALDTTKDLLYVAETG